MTWHPVLISISMTAEAMSIPSWMLSTNWWQRDARSLLTTSTGNMNPSTKTGMFGSHISEILDRNNVIYVSSAGNTAYKHYTGDFLDNGYHEHDFSGGKNQSFNFTLDRIADATVVLQWNDRFAASDNNYDLYLYDRSTGQLSGLQQQFPGRDAGSPRGPGSTRTREQQRSMQRSVS